MAAGRREREQASHHIFPDNRQRRPASPPAPAFRRRPEEASPEMRRGGNLRSGGDQSAAAAVAAAAGFREHAAGEASSGSPPACSGRRSCWADNVGVDNTAAGIRASESQTPRGGGGGGHSSTPENVGAGNTAAATAAGKRNSFSVNMGDIMNHVAVKDGRAYGGGGGPSGSIGGEDPGLESSHGSRQHESVVADELPPPASARGPGGSEMAGVDDGGSVEDLPDQAYLHSLGYGNLGSVLPILLDRRSALEVSRRGPGSL